MALKVKAKPSRLARFSENPARVIVGSFALLIIIGTLLLSLPIATKPGRTTTFLDALFTATSSACVTGLVVKDTFCQFTRFGQTVILILIQCGGLGLVTFATFFNMAIRKKVGLKNLHLASESMNTDDSGDTRGLIRMILVMTLSIEFVGAVILGTVFIPKYRWEGVFKSVFLSISMFCNAGFDVLGNEGEFSSFVNYYDNPIVLFTVMALVICGGLGFIVWEDIYHYKKKKKLTVHSKIVLSVSLILIVAGAVAFGAFEWDNALTLGKMSVPQKLMNSLFHSVSARTAGVNTVPMEALNGITKLFVCVLMFIGAAPGSTGGGVKITTAYVLIMTVVSTLRGKSETIIGRHKVGRSVVYKALAVTMVAFAAVIVTTGTIYFTSHSGVSIEGINALFESVSAFGTVGLSSGVTALSNVGSRIVLILTMFLGRVYPVSLALSLAMKAPDNTTVIPEAKIMVG